jgi:hypothetical protein
MINHGSFLAAARSLGCLAITLGTFILVLSPQTYADERPRDKTLVVSGQSVQQYSDGRSERSGWNAYIYFAPDGTVYADLGGSQGVMIPSNATSASDHHVIPRSDGHTQTSSDSLQIFGNLQNFNVAIRTDIVNSGGPIKSAVTFHARYAMVLDISGNVCVVRNSNLNDWWENAPDRRMAAIPGSATCQLLPGRHLSSPETLR